MIHHVKDGWTFSRGSDGNVTLSSDAAIGQLLSLEMSADEWVSALTSLAHEADTPRAHALAAKLHLGAPPPARQIIHRITGYTGLDRLLGLLPERWQARWCGRVLMRGQYAGADLDATDIILRFPHGSYRIVDAEGRVELVTAPTMPAGL